MESLVGAGGPQLLCSRYGHVLTPYVNSVPAVIAKASAIYNPIIYAITHPKYRCGPSPGPSPRSPGPPLWAERAWAYKWGQRLAIFPVSYVCTGWGTLAAESS